jgi:muramoyltetrapeptide carboxypeptidase
VAKEKGMAMSPAPFAPPSPRWPRPLKPGGTIGICSPSGPTKNAEAMARGVKAFEERGYRVRIAPHALATQERRDYLAGADDERLADLNGLLADPTVDAIICARGGYGSAKLLDRLDYEAIRRDPKPLIGYSDITALSLGIAARTGVVTFSGIMVTAGDGFGQDSLDPFSEQSFWQAVGNAPAPRVLTGPPDAEPWTVHQGDETVSGPLFPVCLSLLTSLLGTPYCPDLTGAILVIEDVHEELYAVDRCLTQLRLAGIFDNLAALLIGSFNGIEGQEDLLRVEVPRLAREMTPPHVAVASGIPYGHIPRRFTLPVGAPCTVDLAAGTFTMSG